MINSTKTNNHSNYVHLSIENSYLQKPLIEKTWNVLRTVFNSSLFYLSMVPRLSPFPNSKCCIPKGTDNVWKENNKGLFVIIHGLKGSPLFTTLSYLNQIEKDRPNQYEVRVPYVPHAGDCSLETAADPILDMVRDYVDKNPGKPVNLIGTSNGGRIVAYVETGLRDKDVSIRVTGIAGVFFGSINMNLLSTYKIASYLFKPEVISELQVASPKAIAIIEKMQAAPTLGKRFYEFYATVNDLYIPNFSSCFPKIPNAKYHLVTGYDHISIANAICKEELQRAYKWMDATQCL